MPSDAKKKRAQQKKDAAKKKDMKKPAKSAEVNGVNGTEEAPVQNGHACNGATGERLRDKCPASEATCKNCNVKCM